MSIFMQQSRQQFDVIIIGAGASGLFCAFHIAQMGKSVLVLDHANKAGKKILMSGGGRCNFTNLDVGAEHYISQNRHFVRSALSGFTPQDFLAYVDKHGIEFCQREHGQLFCEHSSKDILQMLLTECADSGVVLSLDTVITNIAKPDGFVLNVQKVSKNDHAPTKTLHCTYLVVATGGLSIPTLGASGFGYQVAEQFGHEIVPTRASLVPFTFSDGVGRMIKELSGISMDVAMFNDRARFELPLLFTHRGLSGPVVLQMSNYWQVGETLTIDLLPRLDVYEFLLEQKRLRPKQLIRTVLAPFFAKKLLLALEKHFWQDIKDNELANIKDKALNDLAKQLKHWQVKPSGTEGYRVAEVTLGGVNTKDIVGKTMQSRLVPNLYFVGEVLDVTGWLGGYNFQWAWASAFACASDIGTQV